MFEKTKISEWKTLANDIIKEVQKYSKYLSSSKKEIEQKIYSVFEYSFNKYKDLPREHGGTLWDHVIGSLDILMNLKPDLEAIELCMLHEVFKLNLEERSKIKELFGEKVLELLDQFNSIKKIDVVEIDLTEEKIQNLRQMFLVLAKDVRVVFVKIATRAQGITNMDNIPTETKKKIASEILNIYAPIASRLGLYKIKVQLEDNAFKYYDPIKYSQIESELMRIVKENPNIIEETTRKVESLLREIHMKGLVKGRIKSIYSIYKKLVKRRFSNVGEIFDIFALRVIVPKKLDCYRLLSYLHEHYVPIYDRIKDFIARPKQNYYQSLHTTVTSIYSKNQNLPVEIQIRTKEMDEIAEFGIASHSHYKEIGSKKFNIHDAWQNKLVELSKEFKFKGTVTGMHDDISELIEKIFVLTPKGDVVSLPKGATPLDFAYYVHEEVGYHCISAKVNSKIVPLSHELKTGDVIEIITRKDVWPTVTSLIYAKTNNAKKKIKNYLNKENFDDNIERGRKILNEYLKNDKKEISENNFSLLNTYLGKGTNGADHKLLLSKIASGEINPQIVVDKILNKNKPGIKEEIKKKIDKITSDRNLIIGGFLKINHVYAKCCDAQKNMKNGDKLVAYITKDNEIKIHTEKCKEIKKQKDARKLDVEII